MNTFAMFTLGYGAGLVALAIPLLSFPRRTQKFLTEFPRNVRLGRVLALIALLWGAWMLLHSQMAWVERHRGLIYLLIPAACAVVFFLMDDLLAPRALGGILLLAPTPILNAAFMEPSSWRLGMVVLAYLLVVIGMVLVWSPYMFRKFCESCVCSVKHCSTWGVFLLLLGLALCSIGWFAFA